MSAIPTVTANFETTDMMNAHIVLSEVFVQYLLQSDGCTDKWKEQVQLCWMMLSEMLREQIQHEA